MALLQIDPRFLETDTPLCEGCLRVPASEVHHKEHKQMGGRHGAAKAYIERPKNKIKLCRVCHAAGHLIPVYMGTHCCKTCPKRADCYYGAKLTRLPYEHLTPRW